MGAAVRIESRGAAREIRRMLKKLSLAAAIGLALLAPAPALADAKFEAFIQQKIWPLVKSAGVSRALFDEAFEGVTEPDEAVLKLARNQPEFTSTTSQYLAKAVTPIRIETGQSMKAEHAKLLASIEKRYGVDKHAVLAIWGMESNFGKDKGSMKVVRSLATLIYAGRKQKYAREQIVSAFKILKNGIRTPGNFTGSWAAAMGHTQFIPSSYLAYAVDWTGDGKVDIWDTYEDALASTANYLAKAGWKNDRPWGWEVTLPKGFNRALIGRQKWRTVAEWQGLGLARADGEAFGSANADAFVMIPQGIDGPKFLVTKNFLAIMDYNLSHSYAIAVGHLGDRIRGRGPIQTAWPDVDYDLTFAQRVEIQRLLQRHGFNPGGDDGRFGARTYEAIIGFQKKAGMKLDGVPDVALLERLRAGG
jgi:membrane-bound lytic murein transglycosylase B